ncbi:MAG: hypothetical protein OQK78_11035 [Gammaproteobacteria bacterium]|nr:hypothetical protein [Gammaproteobacteria bacterium]MCW8888801.1 hypothetical protein [Gammaproteobacteria bacterium]MCW8983304.1 hypothetical protein [Gammaproteobacteria bacterium]
MNRLLKGTLLLTLLAALWGCTEEQQNRISRVGVSWLEGDYQVTYAVDGHTKSWQVIGGKVTSEAAKGYYYFWATDGGKRFYVQTPIDRTYIEELP